MQSQSYANRWAVMAFTLAPRVQKPKRLGYANAIHVLAPDIYRDA